MNQENIDSVAAKLTEAAKNGQKVDGSSLGLAAHDIETAYRIQARVASAGDVLGGWKIGATNPVQQELLGISEPFFGGIFLSDILPSGARLGITTYQPTVIEPEVGFELSDAVSEISAPVTIYTVTNFVAAIRPTFEIVSPRLDPPLAAGVAPFIADRGGNGGLIIGAPQPPRDWSSLAEITAILASNGQTIETGEAKIILGNPINALIWFLNTAAQNKLRLAAGQIVASGSLTKPYPVTELGRFTANFDGLGDVEVNFSN